MSRTFSEVKSALIKQFKHLLPTFDIFGEEIVRTQDDDEGASLEDWVYLDIIPAGNVTASQYHTDRSILIDVSIHTKKENNSDYLELSESVDAIIRPVFHFGTRSATVQNIEFKVVDKVLHAIFSLDFRDTAEEPEPPDYMGMLDTSVCNQ